VHRLSVLLSERLMELPGTTADITPLVELSLLVSPPQRGGQCRDVLCAR
jgi:hypothetical protein